MARRNQSTFLNDIYFIFSKLPWWLGAILAPLSYLYIDNFAVMPIPTPKQPATQLLNHAIYQVACIARYIIPAVIMLGSLKSLFGLVKRFGLVSHVRYNPHTEPSRALADISWPEFELLVGQFFRERGYRVTETGGRADGGVDLRLRAENSELFLVQCKHWKTSKVPVQVVRELYGVMQAEYASGAFVVTSGEFTADAASFAKGKKIELINGSLLLCAIQKRGTIPSPDSQREPQPSHQTTTPLCPICRSNMVARTARKGAYAGRSFYGCSRYPVCRGTINKQSARP